MEESNKNIESPSSLEEYQEVHIKDLFKTIWLEKKIILLSTCIFAVFALIFSLSLQNYYKSESVLSARDQSNTLNQYSQYSGLASLAGISIPRSTDNKANEAIEMIRSREFIKHLLVFEEVLPSIMAAEDYDHLTGTIIFNSEIYNKEKNLWISENQINSEPSYLEVYEVYLGMLSISQDSQTGFIRIGVEHISPVFAKKFLDLIVQEANSLMRKKGLLESEKALEYLKNELSNTTLAGIKESINSLIQVQLKTQMIANLNEEYVLIPIEPPFIPEIKSRPARSVICILGTLLGFMFGILITLVRNYFKP
tara:strand:+ start:157 stop:1086 length:930 start_codon:yes stop_codon:yes gene_type:complete